MKVTQARVQGQRHQPTGRITGHLAVRPGSVSKIYCVSIAAPLPGFAACCSAPPSAFAFSLRITRPGGRQRHPRGDSC